MIIKCIRVGPWTETYSVSYIAAPTARAPSQLTTRIKQVSWTNMVPLSLVEPAVRSYIVYSGILALKVLGMAMLTGRQRYKKKVFANPEDTKSTKGVVKFDDPDVERVRRAHLNDLENIPAFWLLGALYLTTGPSSELATLLFRVFAAGRIIHTIVYAVTPLPQPARAIAYGIPYLINWYMGVSIVSHYISAL